MPLKVLVVGGGGREHALIWKLAQSPRIGALYAAPGNGGTAALGENIPLQAMDINGLAEFAERKRIELTVVGPDDPLAAGIVNEFQKRGLPVFGPTSEAALMESDKAFARAFMGQLGIPSPYFASFSNYAAAEDYVRARRKNLPFYIKASGLALGKGAYPCRTFLEAQRILTDVMVKKIHGDAGATVVIEEFLTGREFSVHVLCDGATSVMFPLSRDYKTLGEDNRGPNTGGMGAITPVSGQERPFADIDAVRETIVAPILAELARQGRPFSGCFYPGIIATRFGLRVLECNVRFGDPETQAYMRLMKSDLLEVFEACVGGTLARAAVEWHLGYAACVVMAADGYPDRCQRGLPITGITAAEAIPGVKVFQAGTIRDTDGRLRTNGGRVLNVTADGETLRQALERAYIAARLIHFEGAYYRRDIGS